MVRSFVVMCDCAESLKFGQKQMKSTPCPNKILYRLENMVTLLITWTLFTNWLYTKIARQEIIMHTVPNNGPSLAKTLLVNEC